MDGAAGDLGGGEFQAEGATGAKALRQGRGQGSQGPWSQNPRWSLVPHGLHVVTCLSPRPIISLTCGQKGRREGTLAILSHCWSTLNPPVAAGCPSPTMGF